MVLQQGACTRTRTRTRACTRARRRRRPRGRGGGLVRRGRRRHAHRRRVQLAALAGSAAGEDGALAELLGAAERRGVPVVAGGLRHVLRHARLLLVAPLVFVVAGHARLPEAPRVGDAHGTRSGAFRGVVRNRG